MNFLKFVAVLAALYIYVTPYITVFQMEKASDNNDVAALSKHVDFSKLRESVRENFNAGIKKSPSGNQPKFGEQHFLAQAFIGLIREKVVEDLSSPETIIKLISEYFPKIDIRISSMTFDSIEKFFKRLSDSMSYRSFDEFVVKINHKNGDEILFILHRDGLGWKLSEINYPLH